jgi:molecular chaperone GrpE (heat shock protein)
MEYGSGRETVHRNEMAELSGAAWEPAAPCEATPETAEQAETTAEQPGQAFEDLSQEIRRVGRELFKTNRASERHQELFEAALDELRQLSAAVAQVPAQSAEAIFEAKASLGRELLGVADALEASLIAATEVLARLRTGAEQPSQGMLFRFSLVRQLRDALAGSVGVMGQWYDGQQLLYERLMSALQAAGIRPAETVGRPFDPAFHRAVSVERRRDVASGTIVAEERKGYLLDGKVLRYAEVVVAKDE